MEVSGSTIALIIGLSVVLGLLLFLFICCLKRHRMWTKQKLHLTKELNEYCEDISVYENDPPSPGSDRKIHENDRTGIGSERKVHENDLTSNCSDRNIHENDQTGTGGDRNSQENDKPSTGTGNKVCHKVKKGFDDDTEAKSNIDETDNLIVDVHNDETEIMIKNEKFANIQSMETDQSKETNQSIKMGQNKEYDYKELTNNKKMTVHKQETCYIEENCHLITENNHTINTDHNCSFTDSDAGSDYDKNTHEY